MILNKNTRQKGIYLKNLFLRFVAGFYPAIHIQPLWG
jgi:hypothetical protein